MAEADKTARRLKKTQLTKESNSIRRFIAEDNITQVEDRFLKLKDVFRAFEDAHDKYHAGLQAVADIEESDQYFHEVQEDYVSTIKCTKAWLKDVAKPKEQSPSPFEMGVASLLNLPRIELEAFDGDPLKFHGFIAIFDETVDKMVKDDQIKLTRLLQYTTGKARDAIRSCVLSSDGNGYSKAREILHQRFGSDCLVTERILSKLKEGKPVRSAEELQRLADDLSNGYMTLQQMNSLQEVNSQSYIAGITDRLQPYHRNRWRRRAMELKRDKGVYPAFGEFVNFVVREAEDALDPVYGQAARGNPNPNRSQQENKEKPKYNSSSFASGASQWRGNTPCVACKSDHRLWYCDTFKAMKPIERHKLVMDHKLCVNCLLSNHAVSDCRKNSVCSVPGCGRKHTKFIHIEDQRNMPNASSTAVSASASSGENLHMPTIAVTVNNQRTCALLDTGSSHSFCTRSLVDRLKLQTGRTLTYQLSTLSQPVQCQTTSLVNFSVMSQDQSAVLSMTNVYIVDKIPVNSYGAPFDCYSHLRGLPIVRNEGEVEVLIGQDNSEALIPLDVRKGKPGEPFAVRTLLGWVLNGPVSAGTINERVVSHFVNLSPSVLENAVQKLWSMENEGLETAQPSWSIEDRGVIQLWDREVKFVDGRYELPIPWREGCEVPNNRCVALSRLTSLKRNLLKKDLLSRYDQEVNKLLTAGYAEHVPPSEEVSDKVWYLPHHAVISDKKPGKVRIVFDCAAKFQGESLNDKCYQGPDLVNKLINVLLRFRRYKFAITADIEAMYYCVVIPPLDRNALRFLWFSGDDILTYRMTRHVFGGVWCASSSTYALRRALVDNAHVNPLVIDAISNSFYVDDFLHSTSSSEEAIAVMSDTTSLLNVAGFRLTKFLANDRKVMEAVPESESAVAVKYFGPETISKALGVKWNVHDDSFYFEVNVNDDTSVTRRKMLSTLSSMFDPLGLISPVVVRGKILFQDATRLKTHWDTPVPMELEREWGLWIRSLSTLSTLTLPRSLLTERKEDVSMEVHLFSDSSERAYGCCAYLRSINRHGEIRVTLLMSKCKVAPIKAVSIPRLELQAAALSARLGDLLLRELDLGPLPVYYWVDSEIALKYIKNEDKRFHVFIANRVSLIRSLTEPSQWSHISGKQNPSDLLTRRCLPVELLGSNWFQGPQFLRDYKSTWSVKSIDVKLRNDDPEVKPDKAVSCVVTTPTLDGIDRLLAYYSDWYRLKRAVAWLLRLKAILRCKQVKAAPRLQVEELAQAEVAILKYVQRQYYPAEASGKPVGATSRLAKLSPVLNEDGLICVGGRLDKSNLQHAHKHPVIVPHEHHVARAIATEFHNIAHNGTEWVVSQIRAKYWITKIRKVVTRVSTGCFKCRLLFAKPCTQRMADLPSERLQPDKPPFTYLGVDCFGPFLIKQGRSEIKRYGCLFTCFTTRAVHIEKLNTMESDSFLNAFRRFIARRGRPDRVWSDNGSNFVGGKAELDRALLDLDQDVLERFGLRRGISWHFNPPTASHMGGVYERMIRTVRKVMVGVVNVNVKLTDEVLETLFCEVEQIVNGRPITKVSDSINDSAPLTPNHLLLLRESPAISLGEFHKIDVYKRRWRCVQALAEQFWHKWLHEYLLELQKRQKWLRVERNVKVGDLVLLCDENTPRGIWPIAIVTEVQCSPDGLVRSAKVKTKSTTLVRPIAKLVLLEGATSEQPDDQAELEITV